MSGIVYFRQADALWCVVAPNGDLRTVASESEAQRMVAAGSLGMSAEPMDVCAACGQVVLTTPDDPMQTLLCDVCLVSLERRREVRRANAALNQGGLF
jgi:hypothetical protein